MNLTKKTIKTFTSAIIAAIFVLTLGTFSFGQTSSDGFWTQNVAPDFYQLLIPTAAPTGEPTKSEANNAKTASDDVVQAPAALVTIVNYDFNTTPCTAVPASTATNVSSTFTISSTTTCASVTGVATTGTAFTANAAGTSPSISGLATTSTVGYYQFQLGGSALNIYSTYKIYFQTQRSGTGPPNGVIQYSTNGTTFTDFQTFAVPTTNAPFLIDLSSVTALNNTTAVYFRIASSGATGTAGTFRIDNFQVQADNGAAATPTVSLSASSNTASEATPTTTVTVTATLSNAVATDQTVTLGTSGTATLGSDYSLAGANLSGTTLTIPANSTTSSVTFTVIDDALVEGTENAVLTISNPSAGITLGTPVSQTIAIADNDVAANPTVNLSIAPATGSETGQTQFTATVTASSAVTGDQTVNFALTGGTASTADFTTIAGTITIPSGSTTGTTTFSVIDDIAVEGTENGTFTISNPSAGITLGTTTTASVSITDNDVAAASDLTITQSAPTAVAVGGTLNYTVVFSNAGPSVTGTPFVVSFTLPDSGYSNPMVVSTTGCSPNNTISGNTITFTGCTLGANASQTITIAVTPTTTGTLTSGTATVDVNNNVAETDETNNAAAGVTTIVNAAPTNVVINEIYGGGGNANATYNADYIELYNNGTTTVGIGGYSLQYASATGTFNAVIVLPGDTIPAGGFYLVQTRPAQAVGAAITPNFTSPNNVDLSATSGNVLFATGTTTVGTCPAAGAANVVDRVGYGTGACFEGPAAAAVAAAAPAGSNTISVQRVPNGTDTNNNSADFIARVGTPGTANLGPTAATAQIGGRVIDNDNQGLSRVYVTLSGGSMEQSLTVLTNGFGYYNFPAVAVGETYIVTVSSKTYTFNQPTVVFTVSENLTDINFIGYR